MGKKDKQKKVTFADILSELPKSTVIEITDNQELNKCREAISGFLDLVEGKESTNKKSLEVYRKYKNDLANIEKFDDIFSNLYDNKLFLGYLGDRFFAINGIHDCLPKPHYKSYEDVYKQVGKIKTITLRSVYENFYSQYEDLFGE